MVVVAAAPQQGGVLAHTGLERRPVLARLGRPAGLGHGHQAGQGEVFEVFGLADVLAPKGALHTVIILRARGGDAGGYGHVVVGVLQRVVAIAGAVIGSGGLAVDVVGAAAGIIFGDDRAQAEVGSLGSTRLARIPAVDGGTGVLDELRVGAVSGNGLVPHGDALAERGQVVGYDFGEAALQLVVARHAFGLVQGLALGVVLPGRGGRLVTADVEHLAGEQRCDFRKDVLGELNGALVGHVEHVGADTAGGPHAVRAAGVTAELGIGSHGGSQVAGHLDLGHNGDVERLGVGHHVLDFLLRVEVGSVLLVGPVLAVLEVGVPRVAARGGHGGQFGVLLHLDAPALVVRQVPVEMVHLVVGHQAEHLLDFIDREEVAAHVEHEASVGEARRVVDGDERQRVVRRSVLLFEQHVGGQHLLDALQAVEEAHGRRGFERDAGGGDGEFVALVVEVRGAEAQLDGRVLVRAHRDGAPGGFAQGGGEGGGLGGDVVRQASGVDGDRGGQRVLAAGGGHLLGPRREVHGLGRGAERHE